MPATAMPLLHGDKASIQAGPPPHLTAIIVAADLGAWVRAHRHTVIPKPPGQGGPISPIAKLLRRAAGQCRTNAPELEGFH